MRKRVNIVFCYDPEDRIFLEALKMHLKLLVHLGLIHVWHDADIAPGTPWEEEVRSHLDTAHIILLLISPNFMNAEYCYSKQMGWALERHTCGEAHVIPIILRPVSWQSAPFGKLQVLPKDALPVTKWKDQDDAFLDVAEGIRKTAETIISSWERRVQERRAKSESVWKQIRAQALQKTLFMRASMLPGGEMEPLSLDFIWIIDSSRSMKGDKIQALNSTIPEVIPELRCVAQSNPHARVRVHAITFSTGAYWHVSAPLEDFQWLDVTAEGERDVGQALSKVAEYLSLLRITRKRGLPPVLVLITDGYSTDDVACGIKAIMDEPWGRLAVRLAIGIGANADYAMLERFTGTESQVMTARNSSPLTQYIRWAYEMIEDDIRNPLPSPPLPAISDAEDVW